MSSVVLELRTEQPPTIIVSCGNFLVEIFIARTTAATTIVVDASQFQIVDQFNANFA
jgi:hypothetical protein